MILSIGILEKLLNPGILKIMFHYFPSEFPYHSHWNLYLQEEIIEWDGLTSLFLKLVEKEKTAKR